MRRLSLRIRPVLGEPGHGVMLRLAGRHGARSVPRFARSVGLDWRGVLAGHQVAAVATLAGLDVREVGAQSPSVDAAQRTVILTGETLRLGDWSVTKRRVCPACVADDAADAALAGIPEDWMVAHRLFLDVRSITRCPVHRRPLVDSCPGCGASLLWSRAPIARCPKGCRIADFGGQGDLDVALDAYLAGRLGVGSRIAQPLLDGLPFRRTVQFLERVGHVAVTGWIPRMSRRTSKEEDACRRAGFAMLAGWPASLFQALDGLLEASAEAGDGLIARYGWMHPDWLSVEDDEASALVRPLVREHAVRNGVVARDEPILLHPARPTVSLSEARAAGGMGFERTRRMLVEAGVVPAGSRRGVAFAMDPAAVAATLRAAAPEILTRAEAGRRLGLGRSRVADLLEAGLLDRSGKCVTLHSVSALRRLLLEAGAKTAVPEDAKPLIGCCRARGISVVLALSRIVSGTLEAWTSEKDGTLGISIRPGGLAPPRRVLRRDHAARRMGIHPSCMGQLVRAGVIGVSLDGGVDESSLDKFMDRHVAASELAAKGSSSPKIVISRLAGRGVLPAFGPPLFSQVIFDRSALRGLNGGTE